MLTVKDIESLGFWYDESRDCFYRSQTELGIILKKDGTIIIDNVGAYASNTILFEGKLDTIEQLREKLNELSPRTP